MQDIQDKVSMPGRGMFFSGVSLSTPECVALPTELSVTAEISSSRKGGRTGGGSKGGQARILTDEEVRRMFRFIEERAPVVEPARLKATLAFYAGLRSVNIAKLTIWDVTKGNGEIDDVIRVAAAKLSEPYEVPMVPAVAEALRLFRLRFPHVEQLAICKANAKPQNSAAVCRWFKDLFNDLGYVGASSHSGRRTFLTNAARAAAELGHSMVDVQKLAGHASLETTQRYIGLSKNLVALATAATPDRLPWDQLPRGPAGGRRTNP
jgi:integrase/recombinase XerD